MSKKKKNKNYSKKPNNVKKQSAKKTAAKKQNTNTQSTNVPSAKKQDVRKPNVNAAPAKKQEVKKQAVKPVQEIKKPEEKTVKKETAGKTPKKPVVKPVPEKKKTGGAPEQLKNSLSFFKKKEGSAPAKKEYTRKFSWRDSWIPTLLKYIFAVGITCLAFVSTQKYEYVLISLLELGAIAFFTNMLVKKNRLIGQIVNDLLIILYNVQCGFLYYAGTYVTTVMVENTDSIEALSGKLGEYGFMIVLVVLFTLLPIHPFTIKHTSDTGMLSAFLCAELAFTMGISSVYSPLYNTVNLAQQVKENEDMRASLIIDDEDNITADFYRRGIEDFTKKPAELPENPNVVLIFSEGLSQNVIDDKRNITPNIKKYQKQSLNFINYFNHTFATYRAISGQLYSGYQLGNYDPNNLVSLQGIMKDSGYYTSFVNSEPNNMHFTTYLDNMGFDKLVTNPSGRSKQYLEDEETYDLLYDTILEQSKLDQPFFTAVYTFGTHVGMNPDTHPFEDGSSHCLNKFHNMDYYFGQFMDRLYSSEIGDNTIVIFTTDHASYSDAEYLSVFKSKMNPEMDKIPLFIYYKGVKYKEIDAEGRNSICMAPTVLDFLDLHKPNYFLGFTLFAKKEATNNNYDTVFFDGTVYYTSEDGKVAKMKDEPMALIREYLKRYFTAKLQTPMTPEDEG